MPGKHVKMLCLRHPGHPCGQYHYPHFTEKTVAERMSVIDTKQPRVMLDRGDSKPDLRALNLGVASYVAM